MSEKKFLSCVITEGVFLFMLGLGVLVFPKISPVSFGFMLSFCFISLGGYRIINSYLTRNLSLHYILGIISGLLIGVAGLLLLCVPYLTIIHVIALIGTYFLLESLNSSAMAEQVKGILKFRYSAYIMAFFQFLFGLIIIFILPSAAIWIAGVLSGINFLISGMFLINMYMLTKYSN